MSKLPSRRWTKEETELARQMLKGNAKDSEFRRALGRGIEAARHRVERADVTAIIDNRKPPERVVVPDTVAADAARRAIAPITVTGFVMGDPPIGFSALDRRNTMQVSR